MLVVLLAGCSAPAPRRYAYSWGEVFVMDGNSLGRACSPAAGAWDNGSPRGMWAPVAGCAQGRTILLEDSEAGAKSLLHELAHLDGHADPKKDGYDWKQEN